MTRFGTILFISILLTLVFCFGGLETGYAKSTGLYVGLEVETGFTYTDITTKTQGVTSDSHVGGQYGGFIMMEYLLKPYLGFGFGLGVLYYKARYDLYYLNTFKFVTVNEHYLLDIPLTIRFRPMGLINPSSNFTFYIGLGIDIQPSLRYTTNQGQSGTTDTGVGLLSEGGIGYFLTEQLMIQFGTKYSLPLGDVSADSNYNIKVAILSFHVGFMYQLF